MNLIFGRLKVRPEVYPLIVILSGACGLAAFFGGRAAFLYPDVAWDHKKNPHPWLSIQQREQRKLYSTKDYDKLPKGDRPDI
ncbi:cytochrome c oxidase subunit NDUFA4-like [Rhopilema esculentum]|uniref:cytochrome c oxidase subunit NDUFA4-like n=1 Tax=Rhopilema esculentum TaxID=499914 RepID=UPI0031CEAD63